MQLICRHFSKRAQSGPGFTLVELLVVIAIIAILMLLAFPSLRRAVHTAKRTACAHNLRQVHMGITTYANSNRMQLPPPFARNDGTMDYPHWMYYARADDMGIPGFRNLGVLFETRIITDPRVFYCPGQPSLTFQFQRYDRLWGPNPNERIRVSYFVNAEVASRKIQYKRLDLYPPMGLLALDLVHSSFAIAHRIAGVSYWNLLFAAGGVLPHSSRRAVEILVNTPQSVGNDWTLYEQALQAIRQNQ